MQVTHPRPQFDSRPSGALVLHASFPNQSASAFFDLTFDEAGKLLLADPESSRILSWSGNNTLDLVVGLVFANTIVTMLPFAPVGLAVDGIGNLYLAEAESDRVTQITPSGVVKIIAEIESPDGRHNSTTGFGSVWDVAVDQQQNVYILDPYANKVHRVTPEGRREVVAGLDSFGFSGDGGPAQLAALRHPQGIALDQQGNLFVADTFNQRVRKVGTDGIITTVAGNGSESHSGDGGPAIEASLSDPRAVHIDQTGNLYISDTLGHRIRRVDPDGTITTIAGTGQAGYSGDGGKAVKADLHFPGSLTTDSSGNLYFIDSQEDDHVYVRRISPAGIIHTVIWTPAD